MIRGLYAVAFFFTAVALGPGLAHLFELPGKMVLGEADYFIVQRIYTGWSLFGWVIGAELIATLALAFALHGQRTARLWAIAAVTAVIGSQVFFWAFVFPGNQATVNWTVVPDNWEIVRRRWEYGHAASALLDLGALMAVALSALAWTPHPAAATRREWPADAGRQAREGVPIG
jgi:hypothetical protein